MAQEKIDALLAQLTLEEKLSLLAGESTWRTAAVSRLGIPNLKVTDGPSGARGQVFGEGTPAAFFPSGVSMGATWDIDLMYEIGQMFAEEAKSKSASVLLAPTMCIQRHPLGGRNFESFSEDPFLSGKLATAHIRGLQSRGIGATAKHFVANDEETDRFHVDVKVSPRALREVYLLPFQMAVRDADPWCIMTAYQKVNGFHCDASKELLTDIVRNEWGWDGVFMSDWGGTNSSVEAINAGLDLEMPGPPVKRSQVALKEPLKQGLVDLNRVDESARRVLALLQKAGRFEDARDDPEYCRDDPATKHLLLRAASEGIVMLKNDNSMPLKPTDGIKKLAVVGPNAKRVVAGGGGSAYIKSPYWTSVFDSVVASFEGTSTEVIFSAGAKVNRYLLTASTEVARNPDTGKGGAAIDWFIGHDFRSPIVATTHTDDLYYVTFGTVPPEVNRETGYSYRVRSILKPLTSGTHKVSFASIGPSKLYVDGKLAAENLSIFGDRGNLFFNYGCEEIVVPMEMVGGRDYQVLIEYCSHDRQLNEEFVPLMLPMEDKFQGIRLGYEEQGSSDLPAEAAHIASDCDAAIVVVGRDKEWETEGEDIPLFELPGEQVRLITGVAASCKRTIVVVQAGTPVQMEPWIHDVQGVLYTWYQGQELGNAAAAVLTGKVNPSGRLPMTFPKRIEDAPAYSSFPAESHEIYYSEGLYVGYKWWDLLGIQPLFPIGFGLSFNEFSISAESISSTTLLKDTNLTFTIRIRNTGGIQVPSRQTVIAWISQCSPTRLARPKKQICGFAKSKAILPDEEDVVAIQADAYGFGMYDPKLRSWVIDANSEFELLVGTNALDAEVAWRIAVPHRISWVYEI